MTLYNKSLSPPHLSQHCLKIGLLNTMVTFSVIFLWFCHFWLQGKNILLSQEKYLSIAWKILWTGVAFKLFLPPAAGWCSRALHQCWTWREFYLENENSWEKVATRVQLKYLEFCNIPATLQNSNNRQKSPSTSSLHCVKVSKSSCNNDSTTCLKN